MSRTARYLLPGLLAVLLAAALVAGLYLLSSDPAGRYSRARTLFAFAPAAMLAWLLSRTWPKFPAALPSGLRVPPEQPHEPLAVDEPYTLIGRCEPAVAETLLAKLKETDVRFLIDLDKRRPSTLNGGLSVPSNPVKIFIHPDDLPETESVLASLGMKLGTL